MAVIESEAGPDETVGSVEVFMRTKKRPAMERTMDSAGEMIGSVATRSREFLERVFPEKVRISGYVVSGSIIVASVTALGVAFALSSIDKNLQLARYYRKLNSSNP